MAPTWVVPGLSKLKRTPTNSVPCSFVSAMALIWCEGLLVNVNEKGHTEMYCVWGGICLGTNRHSEDLVLGVLLDEALREVGELGGCLVLEPLPLVAIQVVGPALGVEAVGELVADHHPDAPVIERHGVLLRVEGLLQNTSWECWTQNQSFDTANQRFSGHTEFFQRFKLAATNRFFQIQNFPEYTEISKWYSRNSNSHPCKTQCKKIYFFLAKTELSYHLKHAWSQTFNSLTKKFLSEIAILKLAVKRLAKK